MRCSQAIPPDELFVVSDGSGEHLARVLSGGGVRCLPDLRVPILTGVSVGAINAASLASRPDDFSTWVEALADLWSHFTTEGVFRVVRLSFARNVLRLGMKLVSGGAMDTRLIELGEADAERRRDELEGFLRGPS